MLWLDAHGEFNTPVTSPSGHPHGMVLALLAGLTPYLPQAVREKVPAMTTDEVGLLREWIDQGAEWPKGVLLTSPKVEKQR